MEQKELNNIIKYLHSEINRIEVIAGTLAVTEHEHYQKLSGYDHRELNDLAVEEQNAARQLGAIKQMCNSMAQRLEELGNTAGKGKGGSFPAHEVH
jgi:hypothetical protein